jgi:predicted component of type VI protein secretion system
MNVRFVVIAPESKQGTFAVRLPLVVGRSEEAKFRIQQDRVSRKHCEFFETDGALFIRDLGSTNGTFLDGEQIPSSTKMPVASGGVVRVGSLTFRVEYGELPDTEASTPSTKQRRPGDSTVKLRHAADSERLQVEHVEPVEDEAAEAVAENTETAAPDFVAEEAAAEQPAVEEESAAEEIPEPRSSGGFDFLGAEPAAADEGESPQWPAADADDAHEQPDDDKLGDFFKGLK